METSELDWGELMAMKPGAPIPESIHPQLAEKIGCFRMLNEQDKASRTSDCEDMISSKASKQVELAPQHPEAIRSRVVGEMLWCIDQARSQGDYEAVAAYAMDLAALK